MLPDTCTLQVPFFFNFNFVMSKNEEEITKMCHHTGEAAAVIQWEPLCVV